MPIAQSRHDISIKRWSEMPDKARLVPGIGAIFFESSATKTFADERERAAFRERWLGRYLEHEPQWAYLALDRGRVVGYLVGSVEAPALGAHRVDAGYGGDFAALATQYPAHLHVNLAPSYRNRGIGAELIATFAADAARAGASGVHVVTGAGSRNVRFYERNGFAELARADFNGHGVVFLGKRLPRQETA
jgi:GNAT superfamily N-acetyltransferase